MKKVIPFALLVCALFSLSSFAPAKNNAPKTVKMHWLWWYPTSGVLVGTPGGDTNWSIIGSNTAPSSITFTRGSSSWGPYSFFAQGTNAYVASGPRDLGVIQSWVINDQVSFTTLW